MDRRIEEEILRSLGRIEGQMVELNKLPARVSALESYTTKIKGAVAVLSMLWLALLAYMKGRSFGS